MRPIKISIEYRIEGSNAIFVKEKSYDVTISSTPLNLSVDAPDTISPNQDITLNIKETLNATTPSPKVLLKIDYPVGFQFTSATPKPSYGNNVWNLGDLAPGALHSISVTGKMIDVFDGEEKSFNVSTGSQSNLDKSTIGIVFNSTQHPVTISKAFVEANIYINGVPQREYAIDAKTAINGEIRYVNNLDTKVNDLQITAKITGNAFNRGAVSAGRGFYDSATGIITWDKSSMDSLAEVNPGDTGALSFSVLPLSLFSEEGGILVNPSINIEVGISGKQAISGFATNDLKNSSSAVVRLITDVGFSTKALYYSGPFTNSGPIPPQAEEKTTYTVIWTLSNTANSVSNAQIKSTIPPWVTFAGPTSPAGENLVYNSATKEIVWNIDRIQRGTGTTLPAKTASFQISLKPSLSQVGTMPTIVNDAVLTGHDDFANVDVQVKKARINTGLSSDSAFPANGGVVVQ